MGYSPSQSFGTSSWDALVNASPLSKFIFDRPVKSHWLLPVGANNSIVSMGAGTPAVAEIATAEVGGFTLDADNESVSMFWELPLDIDLSKELNFRVLWSNSQSAATGSGRHYFVYGAITVGTDAIAVAATAADTDAANQADLAANIPQWNGWNTIDGASISDTPGDDFLIVKCYVDLTTITNSTIYCYQSRFYRKWLA